MTWQSNNSDTIVNSNPNTSARTPLVRRFNEIRTQEKLRTLEIPFTSLTAPFLGLPGLVGFWPMSSVDLSSGDAYDISGQGRRMTYTGNPTYNIYNSITPYIDFDGTGDYLALTDAADLDITGAETIYASAVRGLTMGGWFWSDSISTQYALLGKYLAAGNQRSYWTQFFASNLVFSVSSNGTAITTVTHTTTLLSNTWYFCVSRYTPSSELLAYVNGVSVVNTTSIPASIFNSTADFDIGAFSGGTFTLNGRASMCFLCANALSNALISYLFKATRAYFLV